MANGFIGQVHIGSDDYLLGSTLFGICNTKDVNESGGSNTKQVVLQSSAYFNETTGITIHVKFTYANTETSSENLKLQILSGSGTYTTARPIRNYNGPITWNANSIISFTFDGTNYIINSSAVDGSSIQNLSLGNITNEGKLGTASSLVVTNSSKEITTGVAFTSAISSQNQDTMFLRSDGTWAKPSYTVDTNTHRPIKVNGTQILGDNTTALDLIPGSNISITNSSGAVTIANTYSYTHPTDAGNKHIPSGGSTGQFLKYGGSSGTASWASLTKSDITDFPNYAGSTSQGGAANSVKENLILKFDTGTTEGTSLYTYNCSAAKTIDIKAGTGISLASESGAITINATYSYTLPVAKYNVLGGIKPAYSSTGAVTLTTTAASNAETPTIAAKSTTAGRYYAIEVDKNGIPYVNVPWTDNSNWTTHLYVTNSSGTAKTTSALTNGNVYLKLYDSTNARESYKIEGAKGIEVVSDASGNLTVQHTHTAITAKTAAAQSGKTLALGDSFTIYEEKYDTDGHITGVASYNMTLPSKIGWGDINNTPTTLSGYGITDAKIASGVITLGSNTITPVTSVNGHTGSSVTVTAGDLGLSSALRFVGTTTSNISDGWTGVPAGITNYTTPAVGDVVIKGDSEYVCISVSGTTYTWELLGRDSSFALSDHTHGNINKDGKMNGTSVTSTDAVTNTQKFLREDGSWVVPSYTVNTDTKVKQTAKTDSTAYKILLTATSNPTSGNAAEAAYATGFTYNPSSGTISLSDGTNTGTLTPTQYSGNAATATTASGVALTNVSGADDLKAIEALSGNGFLVRDTTVTGNWKLDTNTYLTSQTVANLYVNATAAGAKSNAATANTTTYIHLYEDNSKRDTIQLIGAGGASISATNGKVITITSKKYKSAGSANALTSLSLKYTKTSDVTENVTNAVGTATALGYVETGILYIKSIYYGTTSVSTGVSEDTSA